LTAAVPAEELRLSIVDVADHIERFEAVYRLAVDDPADGGVYEALVRHFGEYAVSFIESSSSHPGAHSSNSGVRAQFLSHGFAGAIKAWLRDPSISKDDLIDAAMACAPVRWR
jgi:hypothetical protein